MQKVPSQKEERNPLPVPTPSLIRAPPWTHLLLSPPPPAATVLGSTYPQSHPVPFVVPPLQTTLLGAGQGCCLRGLGSSDGLPRWLSGKESACSARDAGDAGSTPGLEEMATHTSILVWRIPWTEEPGGLQSTGSQNWMQLKRLSTAHTEEAVISLGPSHTLGSVFWSRAGSSKFCTGSVQ